LGQFQPAPTRATFEAVGNRVKSKMKNCLLDPIPQIFEAADRLNDLVIELNNGNSEEIRSILISTDKIEIRNWTESIWGKNGIYSNLIKLHGLPITISEEFRDPLRMPNKSMESELISRDGHFCRFCGIPVIRKEVRVFLNKQFPDALIWEKSNLRQHAAFQAMWMQFDHIVPHARGGKTELSNLLISCAPCNYGRVNFTLEEIALTLKVRQKPALNHWNGLEDLLL
jgi:hypothetical protein